ncbi:hypothetical protein PGB90_004090 [Kerria lacca]
MSIIKKCFDTPLISQGEIPALFFLKLRGIKYLRPPPTYPDIQMPEHPKPKNVPKVPMYPHGVKPPKMKSMLHLLHYPEEVHNTLIHKQYGIMAVNGGRLKIEHFDVIKNTLLKKLDFKRMFVIWRVDAPWQAMTKRPVGLTLGGGKGNIHHYCTPVAPNRVIVEVGGKCHYDEVKYFLKVIADKMPFKARAVNQSLLEEEAKKEEEMIERNMNPYTYEYMIKNNMLGCHKYVKKIDYKYFGKYL